MCGGRRMSKDWIGWANVGLALGWPHRERCSEIVKLWSEGPTDPPTGPLGLATTVGKSWPSFAVSRRSAIFFGSVPLSEPRASMDDRRGARRFYAHGQ
jgi:hypothetical protein